MKFFNSVLFRSLSALILTLPSVLLGSDWPMFRADASRSGYSPEPLPEKLELLWDYDNGLPSSPAWPSSSRITFDFANQPIIVGDLVIFGCSASDRVVAIDAASGKVRWTFFAGGPIRFAPAALKDRIFVASDDGFIYALGVKDGALLWKHRGGPNDRMCMGNGRMISRWPARGGPVVMDDTVYYTAGIWPSDGIYLYALNTETGDVVWSNDSAGGMYMPQPHPGANANSGVVPQGYLLASENQLFVPTGRAVPAAFELSSGKFQYYCLQKNGHFGGARALLSGPYVINAGCFLEQSDGSLSARAGRGVFSVLPDGVLRTTGERLCVYRWVDKTAKHGKGDEVKTVHYRGLDESQRVELEDESSQSKLAASIAEKIPSLRNLYRTEIKFKEEDRRVAGQTGIEHTLSMSRPDVEALGGGVVPFMATAYERHYEVIAAAKEAVCGGPGVVRVLNIEDGSIRWEGKVKGDALGLAAANSKLIVSTSLGHVYCFGSSGVSKKGIIPEIQKPDDEGSSIYAAAAKEIVKKSGVKKGVCVDLGCGQGELALELSKISDLRIIGINPDPAEVDKARRMLAAAGVYGKRVSIHVGSPDRTDLPCDIANLIVSSQTLSGDKNFFNAAEVERLQRPYGGVICTGFPGKLTIKRSEPMEGAGSWTHQNCNPANTICSLDKNIHGPLEMAWFRDGPIEIADRHAQAPAPLFSQGVLVVEGVHGVCALDAYNGQSLWQYAIPDVLSDWDGVHHDLGVGDVGSNFCLSDNAVFVRSEEGCHKLDLSSGVKVKEFKTPVEPDSKDRNWGYVAFADGILFGSVLNNEHITSPRYTNIRLRNESVLFFAMDAESGKLLWKYKPEQSIRNNSIAIAGGKVYLIDRSIASADRIIEPKRNGKHLPVLKSGEHEGGTLLALDAKTGKVLWRNENDIFGTQLAAGIQQNVLLMSYYAVKHNFFKIPSEVGGRMAGFDLASGKRIWDIKADYKTRPIINGDMIYSEGGAWKLKTGVAVPWKFERSYGCGQITGSTHMLLFRSATLGYLDLTRGSGTENYGGIRPGCWFNTIPAGGRVLVPDGASKCSCSYQMRSWISLQPEK
ncbi:MAG: PQQ-binding-like beta-propeller repeat protein [Kiritimatiellae bacterium]|jgi:outer membrane protein assembly factor BamB|nr:PQQ-binding-like beta-propeller repeat protein [Kiritimatiellia bacterium]